MGEVRYESPTRRHTPVKRFSPRKDDSPSRQLGFELDKALEQLQLHDLERRKVHAYNRRSYHEELDAKDLAMAKAHMEALEAASAKHEAVRHQAEAVLQRHLKEQEEQRRREEEEERQRQEREAREKAERNRRAKEEAERKLRIERERKEAEAKKIAEERARDEAAEAAETERRQREATAQREKQEKEQAEKEEAGKQAAIKAQADKDAAEKQKAAQAASMSRPKASASTPSQPGFYAASPEAEAQHNEYLALHQKLKSFRKTFWEQAKQNKPLKTAVGDMRRAMRTSVGQLTDDKVGNKQATERVKTAILQALKDVPSPAVPVSDYLPPHLSLNDQGSTKIPSLVIYLMSILSKTIIAAFTGECAVNTKAAEPIGTLTAQVFSLNELQFQRQNTTPQDANASLIPILLAKFHKVAPILFGISGPETTTQGRARLGWRTEPSPTNPNQKAFILDQRQHDRMTGLGAGFSSIALRNFSKTRLHNPFPPTHFWTALAGMINTPPNDVQTSHLLLLKSMLENNASERFILFYGNIAIAALRTALVDFPKRLPEKVAKTAAARSLELMVDAMAKERHFRLV